MLLVASMPLSHFLMGLTSFILFLNWLAEWNWKEKWTNLKANSEGLVFAGLFVVCLLGLLKTEDWAFASHNLLSKLPLLFAPIVIITTRQFSKKELNWVMNAFVVSTVFCCVCSIFYWMSHTVSNIRQISIFIDHIRFSLCIDLSIVFCFYFLTQVRQRRWLNWIYFGLILFLMAYLFFAQTLTGIIVLAALFVVFLFYSLISMPVGWKRIASIMVLLAAISVGTLYTGDICYQYFKNKDENITATHTALGNEYEFDEDTPVESGHRIGYYVCKPELQAAWALRSDTLYDGLIEQTLIRYLNSKGLHKDYAGVMALNEEDVQNVEHHIANYDYTRPFGLRRALYQNFFSLSMFWQYRYIDNSTLLQRIELWRASVAVVKDNWLWGVGIGDFKHALDEQLASQNSVIAHKQNRGSHSQFLTYWLMGGVFLVLYFFFVLIFPFFKMRKKINLLFISLIIIIFVSCIAEDTIETQTGRMLFSVFAPLFLFQPVDSETQEKDS